jgi:hypothetical protein
MTAMATGQLLWSDIQAFAGRHLKVQRKCRLLCQGTHVWPAHLLFLYATRTYQGAPSCQWKCQCCRRTPFVWTVILFQLGKRITRHLQAERSPHIPPTQQAICMFVRTRRTRRTGRTKHRAPLAPRTSRAPPKDHRIFRRLANTIVAPVRVRRTGAPGFRQVTWVGAAVLLQAALQRRSASCNSLMLVS